MKQAIQMTGTSERMNTETITYIFKILRAVIDEQEKDLKQHIVQIETKNATMIEEYQTQLKRKEERLNEQEEIF